MNISRKLAVAVSLAAAVVVGAGGTAFALGVSPGQSTGTSGASGFHACIERGNHIKNGALYPDDRSHPLSCNGAVLYDWPSKKAADAAITRLNAQIQAQIAPAQHVEAIGPYPGDLQITYGRQSTDHWTGDGGATLQRSWVACPQSGLAFGGGFAHGDQAGVKNQQVVTSSPAYIDLDGNITSITGLPADKYPSVNSDGDYLPNGWVVEGYNNGATDLTVRPYVICWVANHADK